MMTTALSRLLRGTLVAAAVATVPLAGRTPQAPQEPNPDAQYRLGPDSLPQDGVPKGEVRGPFTLPSQAYPGTQHTYWVYVPVQYDAAVPARLMVFNDGQAFKNMEGDLRVARATRSRFASTCRTAATTIAARDAAAATIRCATGSCRTCG